MDFDKYAGDEDNCAVYIEELKNDDNNIRINAASKIFNVAEILGTHHSSILNLTAGTGSQRIKEEFIPYITEIIEEKDNDDEFLIKIVEQLGKVASLLERADISNLLAPLELMATMEEPGIREKAVETIAKISEGMDVQFYSTAFLSMVKRLAMWDNYPSRISACSLFSICFPYISQNEQIEIRQLYSELGHDDTPMVRRAAASNIKNIIKVLDKEHVKSDIIPLFNKLIKDDIDSVKINAIENSIYLIPFYTRQEISENLLILLKNTDPEGKSWRVRFALAENLVVFANQIDKEVVRTDIYPIYESMIKDQEQEVRSCAILKLPDLYEKLSDDQLQNNLIPILGQLVNDPSLHVRISVAQVIPKLAISLDTAALIKLVLPLIQTMYKDEVTEVRISLIQNLKIFNQVIGNENIKKHVIPLITSYINEKQWRSKLSLLEVLPDICQELDFEVFKDDLCAFTFGFINDHIYAIREQTIINIEKLIKLFGYNKLKTNISETFNSLIQSGNYLFRMTAIFMFIKMNDSLDPQLYNDVLTQILEKLGKDEVPNVKFNVVKLYHQMKQKFEKTKTKAQFKELFQKLSTDSDCDVAYFAKAALEAF